MPTRLIFSACTAAAAVLYYLWVSQQPLHGQESASTKLLIISTDLSAGITGPHGGCAHCNPQLHFANSDHGSSTQQGNFFINYRPQDTDDALATMMALNNPTLNVLSIIPIFGNTDLASEMLVTQWLVGQLKQRADIPVVPGAASPPVPLLIQPPALYFDNRTAGTTVARDTQQQPHQQQQRQPQPQPQPQQELLQHAAHEAHTHPQQQQHLHHQMDLLQLFKAGCPNLGVHQMKADLEAAAARSRRVHIAVLGPITDVACLLAHWPDLAARAVEAVVFLGSQPADEPMTLNGGPSPPDFNVYMDPLAAAVLLHAAAAAGVQLVLLHWTLTSLGTTQGQNIVINSSTIRPPPGVMPAPASTRWLWGAQDVRMAAGFEGPNAVPPGPFDQYVIQYILDPSAFSCKPLPVYMQQCSPAPWLQHNSSSSSSSEPFNAGGDCPGHGPGTTARNRQQPAMMLVDLTDTYSGPLVNGQGLLPSFRGAPAPRAAVCHDYAPNGGRQKFVDSLLKWTW